MRLEGNAHITQLHAALTHHPKREESVLLGVGGRIFGIREPTQAKACLDRHTAWAIPLARLFILGPLWNGVAVVMLLLLLVFVIDTAAARVHEYFG